MIFDVENVTWVLTSSDTNNISEFAGGFNGEEKEEASKKPAASKKEKREVKYLVTSLKVLLGHVRVSDYSKGVRLPTLRKLT